MLVNYAENYLGVTLEAKVRRINFRADIGLNLKPTLQEQLLQPYLQISKNISDKS